MHNDTSADQLRIKYGFWVVIIGLAVIVLTLSLAVARWTVASDVTAVVGSVTGVVGTVVGAFFGVQVGSAGKEKVEAERKAAEDTARRLALAMPPDVAEKMKITV